MHCILQLGEGEAFCVPRWFQVSGWERTEAKTHPRKDRVGTYFSIFSMFVGFRVHRTTFHSKSQRGSTTGTQHKRWLKCTHCSRANMAPSLHPNFIRHLEKAECPVQNKATSPDSTGKGKLGSPNPFKTRFLFDFLFFLLSRFPRRNVHSGSMLVFGFLWHMRVHGMQMGHQFRFNPKRSK